MTDIPEQTVAPEAPAETVDPNTASPEATPAEPAAKEKEKQELPESEMSDADAAAGRRPPSAPLILPTPEPNAISGLRSVEACLASLAFQVSASMAIGRVAPADRDAALPLLLTVAEFNNVFHRHLAALPIRDAFVHNWGVFLMRLLVPEDKNPGPDFAGMVNLIGAFNALAAAYTIDPQGVWQASIQFWATNGYTPVSY